MLLPFYWTVTKLPCYLPKWISSFLVMHGQKSKANNPFFHTPSPFSGPSLISALEVAPEERFKYRSLCINILRQAPFDYLWAFGALTSCQLCDTTKTTSKPCQGLSLYMTRYKCMWGIKTCSFDTRLGARRHRGSSTPQNNRLGLSSSWLLFNISLLTDGAGFGWGSIHLCLLWCLEKGDLE